MFVRRKVLHHHLKLAKAKLIQNTLDPKYYNPVKKETGLTWQPNSPPADLQSSIHYS